MFSVTPSLKNKTKTNKNETETENIHCDVRLKNPKYEMLYNA